MPKNNTIPCFKAEWKRKYMFALNSNANAECLICNRLLNCIRRSSLQRHFSKHVEAHGPFSAKETDALILKFEQKNENASVSQCVNTVWTKSALVASYEISLKIAKSQKPFIEGAFIKECAITMAEAFCNEEAKRQFKATSLSARTVQRRIGNMSQQVQNSLHILLKKCKYFSLCLDESTDIADVSQLLIFVRCILEDFTVHEELLDLVSLRGTTKGIDIFNAINTSVEKYNGDFRKCSAIVTDGAKSMVGTNIGLVGQLRKNGIHVPTYHCVIHQEALCAKSFKVSDTMLFVTKVTNLIRGGNRAHSHRAFQDFLTEVHAAYPDLLLHSDIRWLSAGKCLVRFFALRKELRSFLHTEVRADTTAMEEKLEDVSFLMDLAFLTDITTELNDLNIKLQGKDRVISHLVKAIEAFKNRLLIFKEEIKNNDVSRFSSCSELKNEYPDMSFARFEASINNLMSEFNNRFNDFEKIKQDIYLFNDPRKVIIAEQQKELQMELCDLQADNFLTLHKETCHDFYKILSKEEYPLLRDFGHRMYSMFASTYICESTFSIMKNIKSKNRNSLSSDSLSHLLRLSTTNITIDIPALVKEVDLLADD